MFEVEDVSGVTVQRSGKIVILAGFAFSVIIIAVKQKLTIQRRRATHPEKQKSMIYWTLDRNNNSISSTDLL